MINEFNNEEELNSKQIDIEFLLRTVLKYWWVFIVSAVIAVGCAFAYNRYKPKVYSAGMSILLKEENNIMSREAYQLTEGFGLSQEMVNIDNQRHLLSSPKMIGRVIDDLDFGITYYRCGHFSNAEQYGVDQGIVVEIDSSHIQPIGCRFTVELQDNGKLNVHVEGKNIVGYDYRRHVLIPFEADDVDMEYTTEFGELVTTPLFSFRIEMSTYFNELSFEKPLAFVFNTREMLIEHWTSALNIDVNSKEGTRADISVVGYNYQKLIVFLQTLYEASLSYNLAKKNETATRTLSFLKTQISSTADSLQVAADRLRQFKTKHNFAGNTQFTNELQRQFFDKEKILQELTTQEQALAMLEKRLTEGEKIEDYFASSLNINNASLLNQINQLITIQTNLNTLRDQNSSNPYKMKLEENELMLRENLKSMVSSAHELCNRQLESIKNQLNNVLTRSDEQPAIEAEYLNLEREYKILDGIYTFLLKKESETLIAKASNVSDSEVLQDPTYMGVIAPRVKRNLLIALFLGLALPGAFFVAREYFNKNIRSVKELKRVIPDIPVVGLIPFQEEMGDRPSFDYKQSITSESFRTLRAKLNFMATENKNRTIMVSSCTAGEGKTFCAVNAAISFALSGKKCLIINYDLRRPRTEKALGIDRHKAGLTEYLIGEATLDDIIRPCLTDNLYLIGAGTVPPNPAELIGNARNAELLAQVRERFDVVVFDTAPIGGIADAQLLMPFTDIIAFVVKSNKVEIDHLCDTIDQLQHNQKTKLCAIFNGASAIDKEYRYYYSKGYYSSKA